ncbi:VCBS repeat protein [Algoriphagus ratkowskyi]|uniref:VCBS repeat protein n=1 Tax=Algoriphagus ratkowskyi TaxID=57028 RepID=A0A2W7RYI6_9BACT|nr:VCBS repeat-containing protein [Algoriphagus ratkowskyi]PZX60287.1 VCBS repeat protein [Algoriphagus ratkowskyi]TXD78103.1 hypothetical protein ESW18_08645 [Algoriphagus ratkowskyi]
MKIRNYFLLLTLIFSSCTKEDTSPSTLFKLLTPEETGIFFKNDLAYTEKINPYTFRNFYNGAGVALGDINQDGLLDIFLAGNQTSNKLYLNEGNLKFKDITEAAGVESNDIWSTGVSIADVNGDGLPDIFVCKSGPLEGEKRHNELFINQGNTTFKEESKKYGLDQIGLSQHAIFFDYDKDGDLDLYLLSNSPRSVGIYDLRLGQREIRDPEGGNRLFRNDTDHFTDVSEAAGIFGSAIGYGLGVTVADLNDDSWQDLYVSNDFFERDYLYINNQDGTFTEKLPDLLSEISMGSMGADIADLDNDSRPDIFVTEMLPNTLARIKTKTPLEEWDKYQANIKAGYHQQFTRNTLQRNLGLSPIDGQPIFAEISRQTEMEATDWSWGALIFDADNDGLKDVFVANGIVKDLTDFDFVDFYVNNQEKIEGFRKDSILLTSMIDAFPSNPQQNYWFKNLGNWSFDNQASAQGLTQTTFSTGSAYGDLDNDGDLDLVINNLNDFAFIYQNTTIDTKKGNFLQLDLGQAFGTQVTCYSGSLEFYQEFQPVKGYMSSVDPKLHFGLGQIQVLDSVTIKWPDGNVTTLEKVTTNTLLKPTKINTTPKLAQKQSVEATFSTSNYRLGYSHHESNFIDFDRDRLRFWMISDEGPKGARADLNSNGNDELFMPGAKGQPSQLFGLKNDGDFIRLQKELFAIDSLSEDITGLFFDANGDGFKDLIIGAGGIEFPAGATQYQDRLYLNDGRGNLNKIETYFPATPTAFILAEDLDSDGDKDLILGQRSIPFAYGIPVGIVVMINDGSGNYKDITETLNPIVKSLGMLTDGKWADLDQDGNPELIVAGEWMPIRIFTWSNMNFVEKTEAFGFANTSGLWNTLLVEDINADGKPDIIGGNWGLNSRIRSTPEKQLELYVNDFDQNATIDHILVNTSSTGATPLLMKNTLVKQIPSLRKQLPTYASYQDKTLQDLFPPEVLEKSIILTAETLQTTCWINGEDSRFSIQALPKEIQYAPVYAIALIKNKNGEPILIFGGNKSRIKPELGSQMGSFGWSLKQDSSKNWQLMLPKESGLFVSGEIRTILPFTIHSSDQLLILKNDDNAIIYEVH